MKIVSITQMAGAMARQYGGEAVPVGQRGECVRLLSPRVPARAAKRGEVIVFVAPCK